MKDGAILPKGHGFGPPSQNENDRSTIGYECKRLIRRIEEKHSLHVQATRKGRMGASGGSGARRTAQLKLAPAMREVTTLRGYPRRGVAL